MKQPTRDHTQLICDIGELSGLFIDVESLETFLQKIVVMISEHMGSQVCSVYLFYEEKNELVLKATKGLHPDSVGKVKMKLNEGLTGLALKELRPICEKNASRSPHFKYFPEIGEDRYESFLAVPILRGNNRIGVIVVQNTKKNYFTDEDIRTMRAITSQLANTIETAKLLMILRGEGGSRRPQEFKTKRKVKLIRGKVGSEGFAFAPAVVFNSEPMQLMLQEKYLTQAFTLEDFYRALHSTEKQLETLQNQVEERLLDVASLIFTAQILMLKDKGFIDPIAQLIKNGMNPPEAVLSVVKNYMERFQQMSNAYLREKSHDVEDIGRRILENMIGLNKSAEQYSGKIIVAKEIFPTDLLKFSSQNVRGVILLSGGVTSHLSILSRSLQIPLIIADEQQLLFISDQSKILMDAQLGNIYLDPSDDVVERFKHHDEAKAQAAQFKEFISSQAQTKDGVKIKIFSNINLLSDLKFAHEFKTEGVGLYRTEFPFIVRSDFPSEEEQFVIYQRLVNEMRGKEITFRTLDIGGDKILSYYNDEKEANPFLGMRSIRFSLKHKDIFIQQIRAILRAGAGTTVRIMFPMISSLDEFLEARKIVFQCCGSLRKEKVPFCERPEIGLMIEIPSILEIIDELAEEADFFSIGTNDFIQYMLAVDRTNEKVAELYLPHHPAILRSLKRVVDAALKHKKDISICGDMAHHVQYLPYLLGIGVRKLSADFKYIPKMRAAIAQIDLADAVKKTQDLLTKSKIIDTARQFK
ncbi:MAG: phosphoenolpyruvate--protein phosphotransferase [Candidatus Omnitrophota bacterium]